MGLIYLDNNATTRVAPEVAEAMMPMLGDTYGNPSSLHVAGQAARHAIEEARANVAAMIGAEPREIVFTSGGTEADNLALTGTLSAHAKMRHVVTTAVEHSAVIEPARRLERQGYRVTYVGVDAQGHLDLAALEAALDDDTAIVSVMHANNETGVLFPIERIAERTAARRIPLHVDAVQTAGKLAIDVRRVPISLITLSAHKIHGPKGVGALFIRRGTRIRGQIVGGHQERDVRPGTENVAGIVGFGAAAELAMRFGVDSWAKVAALRDRLEAGILDRCRNASVNGDRSMRIPNTTNISFEALEAEAILIALSEAGVCASSGSACSSGSLEPSHVLKAMGIDDRVAHGAIRFSLSRYTTPPEIDEALVRIPAVIDRLAELAPARV
ncbi:MAG: cysteine desulfurase NifS [Phycisphaerae bacterium]|nr:cysteine desulfurase NifS [Phycisphaerae bacterium]